MAERTLSSKKQRNALWLAADGKCQKCGQPLPHVWHADHIVPYVITRRTNVHEMQALCPQCNRRKGSSMLRKHQVQMLEICRKIREGLPIKKIIAAVTPGGGKSLLPVILGNELIPAHYDKLCWVTPRTSLQQQAESAFVDPHPAEIEDRGYQIRSSTNDVDPSRGLTGFVTTYQALAENRGRMVADELRRKRYILVLDEPHHVEVDGKWHEAVRRLIDSAKLVLFMSGTLKRGDNKRIAEIPYLDGICDLRDSDDTRVIRYTRKDALSEKAIIQVEFRHHDGKAKWLTSRGEEKEIDSLTKIDETTGRGVFVALHTPYAISLLDQCLDDWSNHRKANPRAKLLVVAAKIPLARRYLKHIEKRYRALLAVNDEREAHNNILEFKTVGPTSPGILVTVGMAYEGLDVPPITHIACLTHVRSEPWLEQLFARATRCDPRGSPWDHQWAHIHAPDDPKMAAVIKAIKDEQDAVVAEMRKQPQANGGGGDDSAYEDVIPIDGRLTRSRSSDMVDGQLGYEETQRLQQIISELAVPIGLIQAKNLIDAWQAPRPIVPVEAAGVTPSQREDALRKSIDAYCRQIDAYVYDCATSGEWGKTNGLVLRQFKKPRGEMTEQDLKQVWAWIQTQYAGILAARQEAI